MPDEAMIIRIRDPNSERLGRYHRFLGTYDPSLVDPLPSIQKELRETLKGNYETPHVIIAAEGEQKDIIAAASGNLLPVSYNRKGQALAVMMLCYSAPEFGDSSPLDECLATLESRLAAFATRRKEQMVLSLVEAETGKMGVYNSWGYRTLEGVEYHQPPLDWESNGDPKSEAVRLELMAKLFGTKAYEADIAREINPALRRGFVRAAADYILNEFYVPSEIGRSPEANARIEAFNKSLFEQLEASLGSRTWIGLK